MIVAQNFCPFDGPYGQIGFRLCSDGKTIVLMCDECDAVWLDPQNLEGESFLSLQSSDFIVPGTDCSVRFPESRWATRDEIVNFGWEKFIVDENSTG